MLHIKSFEFSPIAENTYVLYNDQKEAIVIDPGCYYDHEKEELAQFISDNKLTVKMLLNTHCHLDHVFGNKFVAEKFSVIPFIHPLEKELLSYAPVSGLMYNLPFENYNGELGFLNEDETINIGQDKLKILFTPGHSPGSVSFYNEEQGFVISGDVLFQRSIGRTDLPGGNLETLLSSIRNRLFTLPDQTIVYSGHGNITTIGEEKKENPFTR
jgi:glyoxylase-like metal-dependent hydrolase (beta-lactamase superfamily II)